MVGASASPLPIPAGTEARLGQFTESAGIAVANAQSRARLAASRARVVASADQARRTIERDLHDGVQQRLVTLGLGLRAAQDLAEHQVRRGGTASSPLSTAGADGVTGRSRRSCSTE